MEGETSHHTNEREVQLDNDDDDVNESNVVVICQAAWKTV
jgi:hypothetical protein